ncbi:conserved membrane hypothetical protein [Burkholderiales bacterium 8X]|nr:conserved membrane hypothetical protein [Burkholderiales bacterium 8X]
MDLHHPSFQGLLLPLALSALVAALARAVRREHGGASDWTAIGIPIALLLSAWWMLGWTLVPDNLLEKLPWCYAAAAIVGVGLQASRNTAGEQWLFAGLFWAMAVGLLGNLGLAYKLGAGGVGLLVLAASLNEPPRQPTTPVLLVVASLGLAGVAMASGSALLFELALALAAATAGCALWLWPVVRISFCAVGSVPATLAWLMLAFAVASLTSARPTTLLVLAAAFGAGILVQGAARNFAFVQALRPWSRALIVAAFAAAFASAAVLLALQDGGAGPAASMDDPYYQPRW